MVTFAAVLARLVAVAVVQLSKVISVQFNYIVLYAP